MSITSLVLRWVGAKPATRGYPFVTREPYKATRGHIRIDHASCNLCSLCEKRCPTDAIRTDRQGRTWAIERLKCIQCGACVEACAKGSLHMENTYSPPQTVRETFTVEVPAPPPKPAAPSAPA